MAQKVIKSNSKEFSYFTGSFKGLWSLINFIKEFRENLFFTQQNYANIKQNYLMMFIKKKFREK